MNQYVGTYLYRDVARLFPGINENRFRLFVQILAGIFHKGIIHLIFLGVALPGGKFFQGGWGDQLKLKSFLPQFGFEDAHIFSNMENLPLGRKGIILNTDPTNFTMEHRHGLYLVQEELSYIIKSFFWA